MQIILDLKSPSIMNKIAELAPAMMAKGARLTLTIDCNDRHLGEVMGEYFHWAGMLEGIPDLAPEDDAENETPPPVTTATPAPVTVTITTPATVTPGPAVDAFGVPYNAELHAPVSGRTGGRNVDGRWKMKKGADRAAYQAWREKHEAMRAVASGVVAAQQTPAPDVVQAAPAPANPFAAVMEDPGEAAVSEKATSLAMRGVLTPDKVNALMASMACDSLALLKDPGVRPKVWKYLQELEASAA